MKQGYILGPTLFEIFFSLLLSDNFGSSSEIACLHTTIDGKLFNLALLVQNQDIRSSLMVLISHTDDDIQRLTDQLSQACTGFAPTKKATISLKKTNVMSQDISEAPAIFNTVEVVEEFAYQGQPSPTTCPST